MSSRLRKKSTDPNFAGFVVYCLGRQKYRSRRLQKQKYLCSTSNQDCKWICHTLTAEDRPSTAREDHIGHADESVVRAIVGTHTGLHYCGTGWRDGDNRPASRVGSESWAGEVWALAAPARNVPPSRNAAPKPNLLRMTYPHLFLSTS
jgi:hypothetical protein